MNNKNNKLSLVLVLITAFGLISCSSTETKVPPKTAESMTPKKQKAAWADEWWEPRHYQKLEDAKQTKVDLLMLGDSITHHWEDTGQKVWQEYYAPRNAFNLGFGGDRTEQVLWRIQNGALDNMDPKLTVLMIGTNNTGHRMDTPYDTVFGISEIITQIRHKLPQTKILLLAIFPCELYPKGKRRKRNDLINQYLDQLADDKTVHFLNINENFVDENGKLLVDVMPDLIHPNEEGYRIWAKAMEPTIQKLLGETP